MRNEMNQGHGWKKVSCLKWGSDMNSFRVKKSQAFDGLRGTPLPNFS